MSELEGLLAEQARYYRERAAYENYDSPSLGSRVRSCRA